MSAKQGQPAGVLIDQQMALSAYMDALLSERSNVTGPAATPPEPSPGPSVVALRPSVVQSEPDQVRNAKPQGDPPQIPDWGRGAFKCLLFKVGRLTLAAPLAELNGVLDWDESITSIPTTPPWFLGVLRHRGVNVKVINTALLVVPKRHRVAPRPDRPGHIVLIGDRRWGLACDAVSSVTTLDPAQVRWRSARTRRSWLAGTVIEHMCALLDVNEFTRLLSSDRIEVAL